MHEVSNNLSRIDPIADLCHRLNQARQLGKQSNCHAILTEVDFTSASGSERLQISGCQAPWPTAAPTSCTTCWKLAGPDTGRSFVRVCFALLHRPGGFRGFLNRVQQEAKARGHALVDQKIGHSACHLAETASIDKAGFAFSGLTSKLCAQRIG